MRCQDYYTIYAEGREALFAQNINSSLEDVNSRLNDLEHKAAKNGKKPDISRAEKSALLYELGIMEHLFGLGISQKKIASLLSLILNASPANIEKDLYSQHHEDATFKNEEVYKRVVSILAELELKEFSDKAHTTLAKIESLKEKSKAKDFSKI